MDDSDAQWLRAQLIRGRKLLMGMSLTDRERRVFDCLHVRMWELALPAVRMPEREIASWTGIRQPHVHEAVNGLKRRWMVWSPAPSVWGIVLNTATWLEGEDQGGETVVIGKAKDRDSAWPSDTPQGIKVVLLDTLQGITNGKGADTTNGINASEGADTPQGIEKGKADTSQGIRCDTPQGIADTLYSPTGDTNVSRSNNRIPSEYGATEEAEFTKWRETLVNSKNPASVIVALVSQKMPRQVAVWEEQGVNPYSKVGSLVSRGKRRDGSLPSWKEALIQVWCALAYEPDGDIVDYIQGKWSRERRRGQPSGGPIVEQTEERF